MATIQTILFDLDGTLIDSRADLAAAVNNALVVTGRAAKRPEEIVPFIGNGLSVLLRDVIGPIDDKTLDVAIKTFSDYYLIHCLDKTVLYEGVAECLLDLSIRHKLAVVTNKPKGFSEKIVKGLGIGDALSLIMGGDSTTQKKPHPDPLLEALKILGGRAERTLMVGDGSQDIGAGKAAGIRTCVARYGYGFRPETMGLKPDFVIDKFSELRGIVE
ncbi:MAG: HAD-IA family hydrolase [Elusimicrobia bacterium]|nr:HAD-IA family hydrolase [Candidatus Obscuribacterium magneticum]